MAYTALYRKYRPLHFEDVVGQQAIVQTLKNQIINQRIAHAYLFCGTRGTGKTSLAKIFARAVNCSNISEKGPCNVCEVCEGILKSTNMNMIEIDAASHTGVDDVREIREDVKYAPTMGKYKVYIIDEVHMLSTGAFNALLKTLEEPPSHVIFILATTDAQKIPATILSRCQRFDFKRISTEEIVQRLQFITNDLHLSVDEQALYYIARISDGAMRDSLSILDQCLSFQQLDVLTLQEVMDVVGTVNHEIFYSLVEAIQHKEVDQCMQIVDDIVMDGKEIRQFVKDLITYYRNLLMTRTVKNLHKVLDLSSENINKIKEQAKTIPGEMILRYIHELSNLENEMKYASNPRVMLEIALVSLCRPQMDTSTEALLQRIVELEQVVKRGAPMQNAAVTQNTAPNIVEEVVEVKNQIKPITANDEQVREIIERWQEVLQAIPMISARQYLLQHVPNNNHIGYLNSGVLYLRFETDGIMNIIAKDPKKVNSIEEAIIAVTGLTITIQCITESDYENKYIQAFGQQQAKEKDEEEVDYSIFTGKGIDVEIIED